MSTGYALAYRLGITPWERAGKVAEASGDVLLDREEAERSRPLGRALDLGCGRGLYTHKLAARGWEAVGVDNISRAILAARDSATSDATFIRGDVTDLAVADLGTYDFFLDIGCAHGLSEEERGAMARGVRALANPGATLLMLAFQPNRVPFIPAGLTLLQVEGTFPDWEILSVEAADTTGMPRPLQKTAPQWYRLRLRA
jgi:SAM-dependent methyltransferase